MSDKKNITQKYITEMLFKLKKSMLKDIMSKNIKTNEDAYMKVIDFTIKKKLLVVINKCLTKKMEKIATEILIFKEFKAKIKDKLINMDPKNNLSSYEIMKVYFKNISINITDFIDSKFDDEFSPFKKNFYRNLNSDPDLKEQFEEKIDTETSKTMQIWYRGIDESIQKINKKTYNPLLFEGRTGDSLGFNESSALNRGGGTKIGANDEYRYSKKELKKGESMNKRMEYLNLDAENKNGNNKKTEEMYLTKLLSGVNILMKSSETMQGFWFDFKENMSGGTYKISIGSMGKDKLLVLLYIIKLVSSTLANPLTFEDVYRLYNNIRSEIKVTNFSRNDFYTDYDSTVSVGLESNFNNYFNLVKDGPYYIYLEEHKKNSVQKLNILFLYSMLISNLKDKKKVFDLIDVLNSFFDCSLEETDELTLNTLSINNKIYKLRVKSSDNNSKINPAELLSQIKKLKLSFNEPIDKEYIKKYLKQR